MNIEDIRKKQKETLSKEIMSIMKKLDKAATKGKDFVIVRITSPNTLEYLMNEGCKIIAEQEEYGDNDRFKVIL